MYPLGRVLRPCRRSFRFVPSVSPLAARQLPALLPNPVYLPLAANAGALYRKIVLFAWHASNGSRGVEHRRRKTQGVADGRCVSTKVGRGWVCGRRLKPLMPPVRQSGGKFFAADLLEVIKSNPVAQLQIVLVGTAVASSRCSPVALMRGFRREVVEAFCYIRPKSFCRRRPARSGPCNGRALKPAAPADRSEEASYGGQSPVLEDALWRLPPPRCSGRRYGTHPCRPRHAGRRILRRFWQPSASPTICAISHIASRSSARTWSYFATRSAAC